MERARSRLLAWSWALAAAVALAVAGAPAGGAFASSGQIDVGLSVRAEGDGEWSQASDTFLEQAAVYRAVTWVPAVASQHGECELRLEAFMEGVAEPGEGDVRVTVDGVDVTERLADGGLGTLEVGAGGVKAEFPDVLACGWAGARSEVAMEVSARNSGAADAGGCVCGRCRAQAEYSSGPGVWGMAASAPVCNRTYAVVVRAVDAGTGEALPGGSFALRVAGHAGDARFAGRYADGAGGLSAEPVAVACDASGEARFPGLDGADYEAVQVAAAPGHAASPAIALSLVPEVDGQTGGLTALGASVSGGLGASAGPADAASGTAVVVAPAEAGPALPVTGGAGGAAWRLAAAVLGLGGAVLAWVAAGGFAGCGVPGTRWRMGRGPAMGP